MSKLTFYGGVDEIGGNKILVEDKGTKIFFDFGQSFNFGDEYFTGWLSPRAINGLGDFFEFGLLPKIPGLYAEQQLAFTDLPYQEPEINAIFLSHAHFDHVAHICFVDPKIPVYLGAGTKLFMESMEDTSNFCNYREHDYRTFRTGKKIKIDNITVEPIHTDHSIPAAYGFVIRTSDATIVYTGDFRLHGTRKDLSEDFIQKAKESSPDALICEGTRMALQEKRQNYSEQQVEDKSNQIVTSTDKIVFTTHYSRDIDRFRSFYNVAVKNGRKLVIPPKNAYLLSKLIQDEHLDVPDPSKDKHILVYFKRKKSGNYDDSDYYVWERQFMDKMVNAEYVHKNQKKLIMDLDFFQFGELIDIRPQRGSPFIHSMSEPFSEEDIEDDVLHNWLNHFGMQFHQLHASGHLNRDQIGQVVNEIDAKKVFPVHTENAKLFEKITNKVQLVKREKSYSV
ncbi:MAG: MBL fold metallo-hydrolase [Candidatus Bathyarchaeia archaeon]|jgi:ribonuclease J